MHRNLYLKKLYETKKVVSEVSVTHHDKACIYSTYDYSFYKLLFKHKAWKIWHGGNLILHLLSQSKKYKHDVQVLVYMYTI